MHLDRITPGPARRVEVAFAGGIARQYVIGSCPVDKRTKAEVTSHRESNPSCESSH